MRLLFLLLSCLATSLAVIAHDYDMTTQRISVADGLPTNVINRIWQDGEGYIWIETTTGRCRYDGYSIVVVDDSVRRHSVRQEELNTREAIWRRKGNGQLERQDKRGTTQSWQLIPEEVIAYTRNDHFQVADVNERTEAVSTYGGGLYLYDKATGEMTQIRDKWIDTPFLTYLFVDDTGCIWVAEDYLGVACLRLNPLNYRQRLLEENTSIQDNNHVRCLAPIGDDHIIISSHTANLYEYDTRKQTICHTGKTTQRAYTALKDSRGRLWIGTRGAGLWVDGRQYQGLPSPFIYRITEDRSSNLWIAMLQGGIAKIGTDCYITTALADKDCHDILQDKDGHWWVAAEDSLYVLSSTNGKIDLIQALAGYYVCLCMDSRGKIWAGSIGGGLRKCYLKNEDIKADCYTVRNGLVSDNIYSITEDLHGNLWVGTEDGLSCLDPSTGNVQNHHFSDSPLSNVFNERLAVCLPDGRLLFGTHDGIIEIEQSSIPESHVLTRITVTALYVNGELFNDQLPIPTSLRHDENNLTFHFSNFQFAHLSNVLYQYRLEGIDAEWSTPTKDHTVTYRKLPPGEYRFLVRSNNGMGKWGKDTSFSFTIQQPWWNTVWAWLLYSVLFVVVIVTVWLNSRRILRLRREVEVERKVSAFKKDFYDRIEREIRNPVNVLQGATENVQLSGTSKTTVQSLRRGSRRMLKLMDMIRDFHRLGETEAQLKALQDAAKEETEQHFRQIVDSIHAEETEYKEMVPPPANEMTILIVEDDEDNLTHLTDTLNPYFNVIGCQEIGACQDVVAKHSPSILIIDITNDEKEGRELTRLLTGLHPRLPVIHLSASDDQHHQLLSLRSGATDYLSKPFSGKVLLEKIKKIMENIRQGVPEPIKQEKSESSLEVGLPASPSTFVSPQDKRFLDQMEASLSSHITDENFSVEQWADLMGIGRTQFYKRVKSLTGETPVQHLRRARLDRASCLLKDTRLTIEEVMLRVGFHQATHFYNAFRQQYGMSPKEYRNS